MTKRIFGLDIIRCVAILLVVQLHGNFLLEPAIGLFPYIKLPDGVELFFVLSGFLIGGILIRQYENESEFGFTGIIKFWKRRWIRTLPNYYLVLLLNILVAAWCLNGSDIEQVSWKFFFFLQNFNSSFHSFFWESWSLSIEEWFYISLPVLLWINIILFRRFLNKKNIIFISILLLMLLPIIYRAIVAKEHSVDFFHFDIFYRKMVITRLDSIVYGVLFAWVYYYFPDFWNKIKYPALIFGIIYLIVFSQLKIDINNYWVKVAYFPITSFCCALFLPIASGIDSYYTKVGAVVTFISKISYSMYLLHLGLLVSIIQSQTGGFSPLAGVLWFLFYIFATIVLSTLLYKYYEKPIMDRR